MTFDYWSATLQEEQEKTRLAAIEAAKKKADVLLALFPVRPAIINVQESTHAITPRDLYHTYENVLEENVDQPDGRDLPRVRAQRPRMTFLDNLALHADVRPALPALRPEISVVSTVRLYFQSPAPKRRTTPAAE